MHFGLHIRNKIFPKYGICAGIQQTIKTFRYRTNCTFSLFSKIFDSVMHNFTWVSSTMAKFRKENGRTEGWMEGQNDGRTEQLTDPIL